MSNIFHLTLIRLRCFKRFKEIFFSDYKDLIGNLIVRIECLEINRISDKKKFFQKIHIFTFSTRDNLIFYA